MNGGAGSNFLFGGAGDDTLIDSGAGSTIDGGDGTDTAELYRTGINGLVFDGNAAATAAGDTLADGTVIRNVEQVWLHTGPGDDVITALGHGQQGATDYNGGGYDTIIVDYSWSSEAITAQFYGDGYYRIKNGDGAVDQTKVYGFEEAHVTGGSGNDDLHGLGTGNNILVGNGGDDTLTGLGGNDTLDGGDGNDTLDGGTGANVLTGGAGDDYLTDSGAGSTIDGGDGNDTAELYRTGINGLVFDGNAAATAAGDTLADGTVIRNVEQIWLHTGPGNDVITVHGHGQQGATDYFGGGYDTIIVDYGWSSQAITAAASGDGYYRVKNGDGSVDQTAVYGFEEAHVTGGSGDDRLTGFDTGNDILVGNGGDDTLTGLGGNDTLDGGDGNDTLDGGTGSDRMNGGDGDDTYYVDNPGDNVVEKSATGGNDQIFSSVSYSLVGRYVETLTLTGADDIDATGNSLANTLIGNSGDNVLDGKLGADRMEGGDGDDTYYVDNKGDNVVETSPTGGNDRIFSSVSYSLANRYVETLTLTGTANLSATGNDQDNTLVGNAGNNALYGGGGNDTLDGGTGADKMAGGDGNDSYYVDDAGDTVKELSDGGRGGVDTVLSSISYTLGANLEKLTLTGSADLAGTGNAASNVLTGNAGADVLDGGLGNDTLTGNAGADDFLFDTALSASRNVDAITDFTVGEDYFTLDRAIFAAIAGDGALDPSAFSNDGKAHRGTDRIIYDPTSGNIFYDANGSASGGRTPFAHVAAGTNLTAASFIAVG